MRTSSAFSADASLFPVWDARVLFPEFDTMLDLDVATHAVVPDRRGRDAGAGGAPTRGIEE